MCKLEKDKRKITNLKHGGSYERLYGIWRGMKYRCKNPNFCGYKNYGGRGITYCAEWEEYKNFREWAYANGYSDRLTLERKDVNGNYEPSNCEWIELSKQTSNTRKTVFITYCGKTQTMKAWSIELGIPYATLRHRIQVMGLDTDKALLTPINEVMQISKPIKINIIPPKSQSSLHAL